MGLTTIEEFKSKVKGGGYKDRSAASKALGKCKGWNPLDKQQRLLNCTEETEFPEHIVELDNGQWQSVTKAGEYHLVSIGLTK